MAQKAYNRNFINISVLEQKKNVSIIRSLKDHNTTEVEVYTLDCFELPQKKTESEFFVFWPNNGPAVGQCSGSMPIAPHLLAQF